MLTPSSEWFFALMWFDVVLFIPCMMLLIWGVFRRAATEAGDK